MDRRSSSPYQGVGRCRESKGMAKGRAKPHPALGESGQGPGEAREGQGHSRMRSVQQYVSELVQFCTC